jgi:hypothetical protein
MKVLAHRCVQLRTPAADGYMPLSFDKDCFEERLIRRKIVSKKVSFEFLFINQSIGNLID